MKRFTGLSLMIIFQLCCGIIYGQHVTGTQFIPPPVTGPYAANMATTTAETTFKDFGMYSPHDLLNGGNLTAFNNAEGVKGRRFFFDEWAKGTVTNALGKEIKDDSMKFNLDKLTNTLLVTKNFKDIIEVDKGSIKDFTLSQNGKTFYFTKVNGISNYKFVEVLEQKENGYILYKLMNTRLVKADYNTDGIAESGNPYDEYVDAPVYYIMYQGELKMVGLKYKSIRDAVKKDSQKLNSFADDHRSDEIDENYLKNLVAYLNQ